MNILCESELGRKAQEQENLLTHPAGQPLPEAWFRPLPGEECYSPQHVYEVSQRLVCAGLSCIPIEAIEGSKRPDALRLPCPHDRVSGRQKPSWAAYQIRRPTKDELRKWHEISGPYGLAVICGTVSGGLEVIDVDTAALAEPWMQAVEEKMPGLVARLVRVRSPRPGLHCYYRCPIYGGSQKLAFAPAVDDLGQPALDANGRPERKTLIEVKGEGGYVLTVGCPPRCHPTSRTYDYVEGSADLTAIPTITPEERTVLLDTARALNQWKEPVVARRAKPGRRRGGLHRPGDDFNARAEWADILTPFGWTFVGAYGEEERWCRPGKSGAVSATTNHNGSGLLHVFTSSSDHFDAYCKFSAYTMLRHGGDFEVAARELLEKGYGAKMLKAGKR